MLTLAMPRLGVERTRREVRNSMEVNVLNTPGPVIEIDSWLGLIRTGAVYGRRGYQSWDLELEWDMDMLRAIHCSPCVPHVHVLCTVGLLQ